MVAVPDVANIITRDAQDHHITREVQVERKHRAVASRRLAARATAAASAKTKRLHAEARSLLSLIARRKKEITEAFYDIGEALTRLKSRDLVSALGRATFAEVCTLDAGISAATAERLVAIATTMTREQALAMGQKKAMAMITLAAATPEDDTAVGLYRRKSVALPGGKNVSPRSASANAIEEAATAIRHQRRAVAPAAGKPGRGRTTTNEERTFAALLERRLHQLGVERALVTAVATKPGQSADLRFEHIPAADIDKLLSELSLQARLNALGIVGAADGLDDLVALATKKRWGPTQLLEHVVDIEERERSRRGLERRLSRSHLGRFKTIADYDWNWPTKIDRPLVESAVGLHFLGAARNVVLVAPQGLGKTMIAQNIAHQAIVAGHSVLFTTAAQMLLDLGGQESSRALERRFRH